MPELPDVEAVIARIKEDVVSEIFKEIEAFVLDSIQFPAWPEFKRGLIGAEVLDIWRRGKFILFTLNNDSTLIVHLRMTGNLIYSDPQEEIHEHTRLIFTFESGKQLRFIDQRKLGKMYVVQDEDFSGIKALYTMGPEPLSKVFTLDVFGELLRRRKGRIKALLMDQSFIAGIGNVYGDEILWRAGIHPEKHADELAPSEVEKFCETIKDVLSEAVDHYYFIHEDPDWFLSGRRLGVCPKHGIPLDRVKIQGRYSYFCPECQPRKL
ncbi:MAG: DNA-formamidopyrimidine glycosylase [Actinomycetota bacterium]|nr:DNA-formamidopyrimidine glycosylase [Actinomycetota bacterium]